MKNRTLAIFGIATYILSVLAYAEDLQGNYNAPIVVIFVSTIATILFTIMASNRLWKSRKFIAIIFLASSAIALVYTIPLVRGINTLVFIWIVLILWAMGKHEGLTKKHLKEFGLTPEEASLIQDDLQRDKHQSAEQRIAVVQERQRAKFKESTGVDIRDIIPEIGQEISRADIVNHVFRVLEFDRNNTTIDQNNQVKAKSSFNPYGYLLVESPILNQKVRLPIIHRDDFLLAASVIDESKPTGLFVDEELLVTYSPKSLLPTGMSGSPHHVLHYAITPRGTLDSYYSMNNDIHMANPDPRKIFGQFIYQGDIKVQINSEPKL